MKCSLINLMFSNSLSWFWRRREKKIKINCQNSQSQTVNSNHRFLPDTREQASPPCLYFPPSPPPPASFLQWCWWSIKNRDILGLQRLNILLKGLPFLCFDVDYVLPLHSPKRRRMDTLYTWEMFILMENAGRNVLFILFQDEFHFLQGAQFPSPQVAAGLYNPFLFLSLLQPPWNRRAPGLALV